MEIPPLNPRPLLTDLAGETLSRTSAVVREVFGNRDLVQAIVRQPPQAERFSGGDGRNTSQQAELQRVILQIENRNLEALSPRPLRDGQVLNLRLDAAGRVQVLQIDGRPVAQKPDLIEQALAQLRPQLARQDTALPLIRNLFALLSRSLRQPAPAASQQATVSQPSPTSQQPAGGVPGSGPGASAGHATLPPNILEPLLRTLSVLSTTNNLARELPATIRNNGQFLEARIARILQQASGSGSPSPTGRPQSIDAALQSVVATDLKANLLRLQEAIQQALPAQPHPATPAGIPGAGNPASDAQFESMLRQLSQAAARSAVSTGTTGSTAAPAGTGLSTVSAVQTNPLLQLLAFPSPAPSHATGPTISAGESMDLALSTLLRQVAATIARMNVHQLQTVTQQQAGGADAPQTSTWLTEIPLVHGQQVHLFQLRIDEEEERTSAQQDGEERDRTWCFTLSFDIEPMGPMYAQVRLQQERVSAKFWAEQPQTLAYVREELDQLKQRLGDLGLQVTELDARPGAPAQTRTRIMQQLVDIQT